MSNHPAIIIGTPGRITDHLSKGNFNPETIETLIIDEFDKSLEFGFHDEMAEIITQLPGLKNVCYFQLLMRQRFPNLQD